MGYRPAFLCYWWYRSIIAQNNYGDARAFPHVTEIIPQMKQWVSDVNDVTTDARLRQEKNKPGEEKGKHTNTISPSILK